MSKLKAPTGLTLTRNGDTFKATWKKGDSYNAMQYMWEYKLGDHTGGGKKYPTTATHQTRTFSGNVNVVTFSVRGGKGNDWSAWSTKTKRVYPPKKPALTEEFIQTAMTTFSWSPVTDNHDRPIDGAKLQSILVQDCPDGTNALASLKEWKDAATENKGSTGNITPVNGAGEDTGLISGKSYARVIRVREYGLGGTSDWAYIKHVYASPYAAINIRGIVTKTDASLNCEMYWGTPTDAGHPIDFDGVVPQYAIATPDAGMECPDDASWVSLPEQSSTSGTEGKRFTIDTPIGVDKCLFLRVLTKHDTDEVQSNAVLAGGSDAVGALTPPEFTEAPSATTTSVTIKATNESDVADSFIVDYLERADGSVEVLGLHDASTKTYTGLTDIENARIGIKAFVGNWNSTLKNVDEPPIMQSAMVWSSGNVPVAPSANDFSVEQSTVPNTVLVKWRYAWADADACEISWSEHPDGWISTEEPDYYIVLKGTQDMLAIKGVDAGQPLYVRMRYINGFDDDAIYSPYSDIKNITISTVPAVPTLTLEKEFYTKGEDVTCSWIYVTTDGTEQAQATVAERVIVNNEPQYINPVSVATDQKVVYKNDWEVGTQHSLAVNVANGSGNWSGWSEPVVITIAEPVACEITQASLELESTGYELQALPFTVTVEGAGTGGQTTLLLRRREDYHLERPTGEDFKGHAGEVVYQNVYTGEDQQTITLDDLQGSLDDGASYEIYASVEDDYGQSNNDVIDFTVNWQYKAVKPTATVTMADVAEITLGTPTGAHTGDYVDIYRRSVDGNTLIYTGAEFGETYVDPYPTIGDYGYLLVGRNAYGDYNMSNDEFAWAEVDATFESDKTIINFDGDEIQLYYNVDVSHSWNKDFKKTKYLGGAIIGDYIAGVERSGNVSAVSIPMVEEGMIESMRRLAEYTGNCHVRTKDGSSFTACLQVSETDNHDKANLVREFSISVEKVDTVQLDGLTLDEWEAQ